MKEKKKVKGGKRIGSGRKPSGRQKEAVTLYVDVSLFGGKVGARMKLYELWDGAITDTGKKSFIPLDEKIFPPSDREIKKKAPKEEKRPVVTDLAKPAGALEPQGQPKTNFEAAISETAERAILGQIEAIRAEKISKERDTTFGRRAWQLDQQKRIQELQAKLK